MFSENENDISGIKNELSLLKNNRETNIVEMANLFKIQGHNSIHDEKMITLMKETEKLKITSEALKKKKFDNEKQMSKNTIRYAKQEEAKLTRKIKDITFSILNQYLPPFYEEFFTSLQFENGVDISYSHDHLEKLRKLKKSITKLERAKNSKSLSIINLISPQEFLRKLENYGKNSENINEDDEKNKMEIESKSSSNNHEVLASFNANPSLTEEKFSLSNACQQMRCLNSISFTQKNLDDMKKIYNFNRDLEIKKSQLNLKRKFEIIERSCQKKLQTSKLNERVTFLNNWTNPLDNFNFECKTKEIVQNSKSNNLNLEELKENFREEKHNNDKKYDITCSTNQEKVQNHTVEFARNSENSDQNFLKNSKIANEFMPEKKSSLQEEKNMLEEKNIIETHDEKQNHMHAIEISENKANADLIISKDMKSLVSTPNNIEQNKEIFHSNLNTNLIQCEKNKIINNISFQSTITGFSAAQTNNPPPIEAIEDPLIRPSLNLPATSNAFKENSENDKILEEEGSSSVQPKESFFNKDIPEIAITNKEPNQLNISTPVCEDLINKNLMESTMNIPEINAVSSEIPIDLEEMKEILPANEEIIIVENKNSSFSKNSEINKDKGIQEVAQSGFRKKVLVRKGINPRCKSKSSFTLKNEQYLQLQESSPYRKLITFPQQRTHNFEKKDITNNDFIMIQSSEESSNEEVIEINYIAQLNSKESLSTQKGRASSINKSTHKSISNASKDGSIKTNKNYFSGKKSEAEMNFKPSNNKKSENKHNYSKQDEKEKSLKEATLNNTFQFLKQNSNTSSNEILEPTDFQLNSKEIAAFKESSHDGVSDDDSEYSFEEEKKKKKRDSQPKIKFVSKKGKESSSDFLNSADGLTEFYKKKSKISSNKREDFKTKNVQKFDRKFEKHHGAFIEYCLQIDKIK